MHLSICRQYRLRPHGTQLKEVRLIISYHNLAEQHPAKLKSPIEFRRTQRASWATLRISAEFSYFNNLLLPNGASKTSCLMCCVVADVSLRAGKKYLLVSIYFTFHSFGMCIFIMDLYTSVYILSLDCEQSELKNYHNAMLREIRLEIHLRYVWRLSGVWMKDRVDLLPPVTWRPPINGLREYFVIM